MLLQPRLLLPLLECNHSRLLKRSYTRLDWIVHTSEPRSDHIGLQRRGRRKSRAYLTVISQSKGNPINLDSLTSEKVPPGIRNSGSTGLALEAAPLQSERLASSFDLCTMIVSPCLSLLQDHSPHPRYPSSSSSSSSPFLVASR